MYRELSMEKHELNTHSILPFLIDNDMDRAFPNLSILYRIYNSDKQWQRGFSAV